MLNELWKKYIIKIKCEKSISTEHSNTPSVVYLCRICSGFRTDNESLVESHLIDKHKIPCNMHSDPCSCDEVNDVHQADVKAMNTNDDNSTITTVDNKDHENFDLFSPLYCQTLQTPVNVHDTSPGTNDANSMDSISPPHSPVSPVLRETNSARKKITITLNSSPPPPTTTAYISELRTPEKHTIISSQGNETVVSLTYETVLMSSHSPSSPNNIPPQKHKCPDCDRCFSSYKAFERHTLRSHAPTPLSAGKSVDMDAQSSCEYTSTVLSYEFVCSQCDRSFTTSQACKMHARIHKQNKKFNRTNDLTNGNLNEAVDNANHRKESLIESRYRTILPKPSSKQTSSVQFSLLDLKPRRRNARRQTTSSTSSSYEQILSCKKQINHNNVVNNSSARIYSYSDENPQSYSNSTNIFYQSTANNRDNPVNSSNNNHINLSDQIIYDSVTNTSDEICKPSHLLTVASAYASQIPFSPRSSNDTSHSMDNVITDATIVPISADSSIPNIQIYPIPWSSNAHNSSLLSSDTTVVSNVIVNQSIDTSVSCISDNNNNNNNNNNNDNNNNNNQLHTVKAVSTDCASSFTHESSAPYSFIQLYPVMSSDGTLYYITGTPIELTQTDSNDPNHQIGIFSHNTIVSTNCEPEYAYSANEIWSSNEPNTGNINNNNNNNTANINSSLSQQITTTEINSTLHANSTTSDSYLINAESCSSKNNEGTVYLSSHYNSVPENCQPVLEYLSNDVEVIDLNIPAAVVHLDQNTLPSTIVLNASQLATTLYEINSLGNQNFTVSYSNPTDSVLKCGSEGATFPEQQQHQQQSPGVGCSETQNNFDSNGNSDPLAVLNCNSSVKDSRISEKSQISLNHSFNDSSLNNEVNNKIDYESLKHLKEYFDFNKTTIKICNNSVYTVKSSLDNNLINNSLVTDDLHNSSSDFNDSSFTSVCHLPTSV